MKQNILVAAMVSGAIVSSPLAFAKMVTAPSKSAVHKVAKSVKGQSLPHAKRKKSARRRCSEPSVEG